MIIKSFAGKIQKSLSLFVHKRRSELSYLDEELEVPDDVGEGYFAVVANKNGETKRFIVSLEYLTDPVFLDLLDQAKEEYGFMHQGAIAVPCRPQDLQEILDVDGQRASIEI